MHQTFRAEGKDRNPEALLNQLYANFEGFKRQVKWRLLTGNMHYKYKSVLGKDLIDEALWDSLTEVFCLKRIMCVKGVNFNPPAYMFNFAENKIKDVRRRYRILTSSSDLSEADEPISPVDIPSFVLEMGIGIDPKIAIGLLRQVMLDLLKEASLRKKNRTYLKPHEKKKYIK